MAPPPGWTGLSRTLEESYMYLIINCQYMVKGLFVLSMSYVNIKINCVFSYARSQYNFAAKKMTKGNLLSVATCQYLSPYHTMDLDTHLHSLKINTVVDPLLVPPATIQHRTLCTHPQTTASASEGIKNQKLLMV